MVMRSLNDDEMRDFRDWLDQMESATDEQLAEYAQQLRERTTEDDTELRLADALEDDVAQHQRHRDDEDRREPPAESAPRSRR